MQKNMQKNMQVFQWVPFSGTVAQATQQIFRILEYMAGASAFLKLLG